MKQLDFDRAFPHTPDCIHAAIELGFRKGKKQMKMRNKIITLGSIAAALLIMFAAALATGGLSTAPQPDVLAQPPVTDVPKVQEEAVHVYSTEGSTFYHLKPDCSGMENAIEMSEIEAVRMGKQACPVCIPMTCNGHGGEEIEFVYYTQGAKYFHKQEECNGGSFDLKGEYFTVTSAFPGKEPCTECFPNGIEECVHGRAFVMEAEPTLAPALEEYTAANESTTASIPEAEEHASVNAKEKDSQVATDVYYTENGKYYHSNEHCQGMINAKAHTREDARRDGKLPCLICLNVYCTKSGTYYHLLPDCIGMINAKLHSLSEAYSLKKQRCPVCLSPETVYATQKGNYFHAVQDCSGMKGASATTPEGEWANGKLPCPVCITSNVESLSELQSNSNEETVSMNVSTSSMADIDANLSFLGTITQIDRLYQSAFGNLEEVLAAGYGFMPEIAENSWILSNGQQTILSLDFQNTGNDSALEAKWILNVSLNTDREISNHFMESIRTFPMSAMYRMAIDAAQNHMKEIHPRNAEALDPYVIAIRLGIDEEYQVKNCRIQFPCALHALYVEYLPEERNDGGWSWNEKTYTETA